MVSKGSVPRMESAPIAPEAKASAVAKWRATVPELPPLTDDAAACAEALLLHLHYSVNFDDSEWLAARALHRYWDSVLPGRVRTAAFRSTTLDSFWSRLRTSDLPLLPITDDRRLEVATLLRFQPASRVIAALKDTYPALLLRVQIIATAEAERRDAEKAAAKRAGGRRRGATPSKKEA